MRIGVNARLLIKDKLDGIGWFSVETLKRMTTSHPEVEFIFFFDRPYDESFIFSSNITPVVMGPPARHPFLWYWWFEISIPLAMKKHHIDLFFSPDGYIPLRIRIPTISVIHDINFYHRPMDLPYFTRNYYLYFFPKFARKATRIITVSEYSKKDIQKSYDIEDDKIDVVYNGANEFYQPLSEEEKTVVKNDFTHGKNYFLFVGNLHPRKNIVRLLKAFDKFIRKTNADMRLVVIGVKFFKTGDMEQTYEKMKHKDKVMFLGRQSPANLCRLYAAATALTFVSIFEGFGMPIIEAMYSNTPVITSNITSMPEIAGDAAILTNPFSEAEITESLVKIYQDADLRNQLIEKGKERRDYFTWDKTAERIWKSIQKIK